MSVSVRPAPVPAKTIFAAGKSVLSEDVAVTIKEVAAVSTSPTVNEIGSKRIIFIRSLRFTKFAEGGCVVHVRHRIHEGLGGVVSVPSLNRSR